MRLPSRDRRQQSSHRQHRSLRRRTGLQALPSPPCAGMVKAVENSRIVRYNFSDRRSRPIVGRAAGCTEAAYDP